MSAEIVRTDTGEVIETMSRDEAEQITGRIATELNSMANAYEAVVPMIADAFDRRAWVALGYRANGSAKWIADNFDGVLGRLKADVRQEIGERVREDVPGISTRGLAALTGVGQSTIDRDTKPDPDGSLSDPDHADSNPFSTEQVSEGVQSVDTPTGPEPAASIKVTETTKTETYINGSTGEVTDPPNSPPPTPTLSPEEKRLADERQARSDLYTGIARAALTLGGYGHYDDVSKLMADFDRDELRPVQVAEGLGVENLHRAERFIRELIDWTEEP